MAWEFSLSFSKMKAYRECQRRWWLLAIGAWGGWSYRASEPARLAYRLKNMVTLAQLTGQLVHTAAAAAVRNHRLRHAEACEEAEHRLVEAVQDANREAWAESPKRHPAIAELYYRELNTEPDAHLRRLRDRLGVLFDSAILQQARCAEKIEVEQLRRLEGLSFPVWVKMDLAYQPLGQEGRLLVVDWKTGREHPDDPQQMGLYYEYASRRWPSAKAELLIAYLKTGEVREVEPPSHLELPGLIRNIAELGQRVQGQLEAAADSQAEKREMFPRTGEPAACRWCQMFEACKGHRDRQRPDLVMDGF